MSPLLAIFDDIGGMELMLIMVAALLLFGADKLPELARGMGKALREVKKATSGVEHEIKRAMEEEPAAKKLPAPPAAVARPPVAPPTPPPQYDKTPDFPPSLE